MQSFPKDVLATIQQHLEEEKKRVTTRIAELQAQDPFSDPERLNDNAASDAEASEESSHDRFAALVTQLTDQLKEIDAAVARVSDGSYGYCTSCRQMVDTDRLAILPTATLCLNCEKNKK